MTGRHPGPISARGSLLWLYVPTLALSVAQGMVLPAIPRLADAFSVSAGTAGQVVTAFAAGRMAILFPAGLLVDALGARAVLLLGSTLALAGAVSVASSSWFLGILVGQFLAGAGASLWTLGREAAGLQQVSADRRGRLLSAFFGLQMAGTALGPLVAGVVVDRAGLRSALWLPAGVAAAVWLATLVSADGWSERAGGTRPAVREALRGIPEEFRLAFRVVTFATFVLTMYRTSLNALWPVYVGAELGYPGAAVGGLFGIVSALILAMISPAGYVLDRVGRKWGAVPACLVPAVAFGLMPMARTLPQLGVLAALLGLAGGLSLGAMSALSYDIIPEEARGRLQAMRRLVGELGGLVGPFAAGVATDWGGAGIAFLLYTPLLLAAGLLLAFAVPETLEAPRRAGRLRAEEGR